MKTDVFFDVQIENYGHGYETRTLRSYRGDPDELELPDSLDYADKAFLKGKHPNWLSVPDRVFASMWSYRGCVHSDTVIHLVVRVTKPENKIGLYLKEILESMPNLETLEIQAETPAAVILHECLGKPKRPLCLCGSVGSVKISYGKPEGTLPLLYLPETDPGDVEKSLRIGLFMTYFDSSYAYTEDQKRVYDQWLGKNGNAFFTQAIESDHGELLERYLARIGQRRVFKPATYDRFMDMAEKQGNTTLKAALMNSKASHYNLARLEEAREKREAEIYDDPDGVRALRRCWTWKKEADGLIMTRCKWDGQTMSQSIPAVVPSKIEGIDVVAVAEEAFRESASSEYILPESVCSLGAGLFRGNGTVSRVEILGHVPLIPKKAFYDTKNLCTVVFPEGCQSIGMSAFENSGIQEADLPASVKRIGVRAFSGTKRLSGVRAPGLICLEEEAFSSSLVSSFVAPRLMTVGEGAFYSTVLLKSADLRRVCSIGRDAFSCSRVEELHVSGFLTEIGVDAFSYCNVKRIKIHGRLNTRGLMKELRRVFQLDQIQVDVLDDELED